MADPSASPPGRRPKLKAAPPPRPADEGPLRLLQLEADARRAASLRELIFHLANESRSVLDFRQAFVLRRRRGALRVEAISSVSTVERNAPLVRWVERAVNGLGRDKGHGEPAAFTADAYGGELAGGTGAYAFGQLLWFPLKSADGKVFGGVVAARESPWRAASITLATRLSETYSHAWLALTRGRIAPSSRGLSRMFGALGVAAIVALGFVRAPLTAIAPVEVVGRDAAVITAPLDGVVDVMFAAPNAEVVAGDILARIDDTELRNAAEIADGAVVVARARFEAASSSAFGDAGARREIAIAEAEMALAEAERDLARERLSRVEIRAPTSGVAVYADPQDWIGRPVSVGERIMEIADPDAVEYSIALPVDDLIALEPGASARVFLDSAPLEARKAQVVRASYHAAMQPDGVLAYELRARDAGDDADQGASPRIGARGTAQILGDDASLAFIVFRRPIAWARQTFGF